MKVKQLFCQKSLFCNKFCCISRNKYQSCRSGLKLVAIKRFSSKIYCSQDAPAEKNQLNTQNNYKSEFQSGNQTNTTNVRNNQNSYSKTYHKSHGRKSRNNFNFQKLKRVTAFQSKQTSDDEGEEATEDIEFFSGREGVGQLWEPGASDLVIEDDEEFENDEDEEEEEEDEDDDQQEGEDSDEKDDHEKTNAHENKENDQTNVQHQMTEKEKRKDRKEKILQAQAVGDVFEEDGDTDIIDLENLEEEEEEEQDQTLNLTDLEQQGIVVVEDDEEEEEIWGRIIAKPEAADNTDPHAKPSIKKFVDEKPEKPKIREVDPAKTMVLTQLQRDVILALILGGRHRMETLNKHRTYRFIIEYPWEERNYAMHIYKILEDWSYPPAKYGSKRKMIGFVTKNSVAFRFYYQQFYDNKPNRKKDKRAISYFIRALMTQRAFAYFYMETAQKSSGGPARCLLDKFNDPTQAVNLTVAISLVTGIKTKRIRKKKNNWVVIAQDQFDKLENLLMKYIHPDKIFLFPGIRQCPKLIISDLDQVRAKLQRDDIQTIEDRALDNQFPIGVYNSWVKHIPQSKWLLFGDEQFKQAEKDLERPKTMQWNGKLLAKEDVKEFLILKYWKGVKFLKPN